MEEKIDQKAIDEVREFRIKDDTMRLVSDDIISEINEIIYLKVLTVKEQEFIESELYNIEKDINAINSSLLRLKPYGIILDKETYTDYKNKLGDLKYKYNMLSNENKDLKNDIDKLEKKEMLLHYKLNKLSL